MIEDAKDFALIAAVQAGLPVAARPYALIAEKIGLTEGQVLERLQRLRQCGLIKRWGVVVQHRALGYRANAMIVMDIPDSQVDQVGRLISRYDCVNLCYQRPRYPGVWPYNLYCMIHGKSRDAVWVQWQHLQDECQLQAYPFEMLFSARCFKQRGAQYARLNPGATNGANSQTPASNPVAAYG